MRMAYRDWRTGVSLTRRKKAEIAPLLDRLRANEGMHTMHYLHGQKGDGGG